LLGVEDLAKRMFRSLSGGEQQRVRQARALAADPDVLAVDEPTTGTDLEGEVTTADFLRDLNRCRGVTVLIVTHELALVLNLATSILLVRGHGILHGSVDEVLQAERLTELYGVPVQVGWVGGHRTLAYGRVTGSDV
jgi:ABC-type Mn2+/Zn2+ transport system ATPase subunit